MYEQQRNKKNIQENFRRRKISLLSKANDLHRSFGVDVFFAIRRKGKYYAYISAEKPHWPPTKEQIVSLFATVLRQRLTNSQEQSHPLPEMKTAADFDVIKGDEKANRMYDGFQDVTLFRY
jgi:hypothetical protein